MRQVELAILSQPSTTVSVCYLYNWRLLVGATGIEPVAPSV